MRLFQTQITAFINNFLHVAPDWVETFLYHSDANDRDRNYPVAKDDASLLYMVSLGRIEMNPWHSRVHKENHPDWCIIDLYPGKTWFDRVIEATLAKPCPSEPSLLLLLLHSLLSD